MLLEIGVDPVAVLRRAKLPSTVFDGDGSRISLADYFALWSALSDGTENAELALRLGQIAISDHFDPAFFAAMCSPDMNSAARRLADFKQWVGAFSLNVEINSDTTTIRFGCKYRPTVPLTLGLVEIVLLVNMVRRATRTHVTPIKVTAPSRLDRSSEFEKWLGCTLLRGDQYSVCFSADDAARPFLTHDNQMWAFFEPILERRTATARSANSMRDEVERVLAEFLPSGRTQISDVARELAVSTRSLQRKLSEEGTSWVEVLNQTREQFARHYLSSTNFGAHEISFLLGYKDPNSLFRAFHRWTGTSPELWCDGHRVHVRS